MNILIFNTFYFPKITGGAEVSVQLLAEGLAASGNKVSVVTFGDRPSVSRLNGVRVIRVKQLNVYSSFHAGKRSNWYKLLWHFFDSCNLLNYFLLRKLLNKIKPHIVHTNNIQGFSPFIWPVIKGRGLPLVHTLRDYYMLCHRNNLYSSGKKCKKLCFSCKVTHSVKRRFAAYPDCYVGISDFILKKHQEYLPIQRQQKEVIYNSVGKPVKIPVRGSNDKKLVLGFMGRVAQDKGVGYLASELVKIRHDLRQQFKIIFAGKGDKEYVVNLQRMLQGIEFEFPGMTSPSGFYSEVDVAVVPSLWDEPFGRVVIESLSHSVPVILARSGGLSELHNPSCTWSFFPAADQLYPLIEHIVENKQEIKQKKRHCSAYASLFSVSSTVEKYLDVYARLRE